MALDDILQRIEQDSLEEARAILARAEESAAELRARGHERAHACAHAIVTRAQADAESLAQTRLAEARLAARDNALAAKRHLVERVIALAADRVVSLSAERYAALMARWVAEVAVGGEVVSIGHDDYGRLSGRLSGALEAARAPVRILGTTGAISRGVLVKGDRVRVEVSVRARVDSQREDIVTLATGVLFGAERDERAPEAGRARGAGDMG